MFLRPITNHCGNWNSTAPSLPAECSGMSASWNRCQTSSTTGLGQVLAVEVLLVAELLGQLLEQVLVERLALGRVVGEQRVRLDVEREVLRRPLDPQDGVLLARWEVVGRVDLDDRELLGVEAQPGLGALGLGRVEVPVLDEGRVGPARGADEDPAHVSQPTGRSRRTNGDRTRRYGRRREARSRGLASARRSSSCRDPSSRCRGRSCRPGRRRPGPRPGRRRSRPDRRCPRSRPGRRR